MMSYFTSQIDVLQAKQKQDEAEKALSIFCPKCRSRHPWEECPLKSIEVCTICELYHATQFFPSLPGIKETLQEICGEYESTYFLAQKKPWKP